MDLKYADIKLGYSCNNDCWHCVISNQKLHSMQTRGNYDRTTQECFDEILSAKANGCKSLTLTGGEPTIRKDFKDIAEFAKMQGFNVTLQSNGRMFAKTDLVYDIKDYIDIYMIALCGSSSQIHDKITQRKNSFDEVQKGLSNLVKINALVGVKTVISNYNKNDLLNIVKLVKKLGIKYINIAFPHANGNALNNFDEIIPYYKDIKNEIIKCIKFSQTNNIIVDFEAILPCALDKQDYNTKFFTDLKFKNSSKGEVRQLDEGVQDWNKIRKNSKRKGLICLKCIYNIFCEGYWKEYIEKRGFTEFKPILKIPPEVKALASKISNN